MTDTFMALLLFTAKAIIIVLMIVIVLVVFFALLTKGKEKQTGKLKIKNLNKYYEENKEIILSESFSKKELKQYLKEKKAKDKEKNRKERKHVYVIKFHGDIKAQSVASLSEEITAILNVAKTTDEVLLCLESPGGVVPGYGLAAAQLMRLRSKNIPLTIAIDKVAASGGYLMACVANKIISAPFALIGSIGVIVQLPNFNRLLKEKNIDFEQLTAGEYKRTISLFGENTDDGREKLKEEIEAIHEQFKSLITLNRPNLNIKEVATGEVWLGQQALTLNLVDEIKTSDDYLLSLSQDATLLELHFEQKKPFLARFMTVN